MHGQHHRRCCSWLATAFLLATLAVTLLEAVPLTEAPAPACSVALYTDGDFTEPLGEDAPPVDGQRLCGEVRLNTTASSMPYPCYNVTVTRVKICSGTAQNLAPFDPSDPLNTGCHTPISGGVVRVNVIYDAETPNSVLASYNPYFEVVPTPGEANVARFCYDTKKLTEFNNVVEVEWFYDAIICPYVYQYDDLVGTFSIGDLCFQTQSTDSSSSSSSSSGGPECPNPPPEGCGCDCIEGSTKAFDVCGNCHYAPQGGVLSTVARFRDFQPSIFANNTANPNGHPDFEYFAAAETGIPAATLGGGPTGVIGYGNHPFGTITTHSAPLFAQWWFDIAFVNSPVTRQFNWTLVAGSNDTYEYCELPSGFATGFFPIDGDGFGNMPDEPHNYHFTMTIYLEFTYVPGGRVLNFTSQDDLWVYINGQLVVDLGGVHLPLSTSVNVDTMAASLGLVAYQTYDMAIFFAQRSLRLGFTSAFCAQTILDTTTNCSCPDACGVCGGDNSTCVVQTTSPPPVATTTPPPETTTPPPETTTPPPETTTPPPETTTPPPDTTTPPPPPPPPPTTAPPPPPPPPPTNGTATCGSIYDLDCPEEYAFEDSAGCLPPPPGTPIAPIVISSVAGFFILAGLFIALLRRGVVPVDVKQDIVIDLETDEYGRLVIGQQLQAASPPARRISEKAD